MLKPYNAEKKPHSFHKDPKMQFINFLLSSKNRTVIKPDQKLRKQ